MLLSLLALPPAATSARCTWESHWDDELHHLQDSVTAAGVHSTSVEGHLGHHQVELQFCDIFRLIVHRAFPMAPVFRNMCAAHMADSRCGKLDLVDESHLNQYVTDSAELYHDKNLSYTAGAEMYARLHDHFLGRRTLPCYS